MSRPQSMPDIATLMDSSLPLFEQSTSSHFEKRIHSRRQTSPERKAHHARVKPSISLAAGLMMNTDTPLATGPISPRKRSQSRPAEERRAEVEEDATLFYAYAQRSDYPSSPPYVLTFASAAICSQWWNLVQYEYPMSSRPSPQFFIIRSEDMELIQDDPKFFSLRNKWFYSSQDSPTCPPIVLPLQYANGAPATAPPPPPAAEKTSTPALDSLAESLARLSSVVESNAEQVHALSVAQSTGLQAMQEINESNSIQIKAISESQIKLQALVDQNASHYIALSNTSFQSQESTRQAQERTVKAQDQTKAILDKTVAQLASLAKAQADLSQTCQSMIQSLDAFTHNTAVSDTASTHSLATMSSALASRISPPPRKLNRKIKGVWYEYDCTATPVAASGSTASSTAASTPRKRADSASGQTPPPPSLPKSPVAFKAA